MHNLNLGDTVRLRPDVRFGKLPEGREHNKSAKVVALLSNPGGVKVDRDLGGMKYWHETDLIRVRKVK